MTSDLGRSGSLRTGLPSLAETFAVTDQESPARPFMRYFDMVMSYGVAQRWVDAAAAGLQSLGVQRGDRVGLMLQNQPEFVVTLLACWRLGAAAVPINIMLKAEELRYILADSGARMVVCLDEVYGPVVAPAAEAAGTRIVISVTEGTFQADGELSRFPPPGPQASASLSTLLREHDGSSVEEPWPDGSEVASLTYTSGTTGPPKGAMNTHANFAFGAEAYRKLARLSAHDTVMGGSPLFSITGLVANIGTAIAAHAPLVLSHRFDVDRVASTMSANRCTFTVMPIAAFGAMLRGGAAAYDLSSLTKAYSGGAAVSPARVSAFKEATGVYIHNVYGLTEAAGATHAVPLDAEAPVDTDAHCLAVGFPLDGTTSRIVGTDGAELPTGEIGEVVVAGPHVMAGYWQREDATAEALAAGYLHTGDLGKVGADGWYYVVGRAKDQINTSGWKVWPREVEETMQTHPSVFEAAVIGVPDEQRGEVVRGFVSLRPGQQADPHELIVYCRERLAVYKCPREIVIIEDMPKTPSGKIVKRDLPR